MQIIIIIFRDYNNNPYTPNMYGSIVNSTIIYFKNLPQLTYLLIYNNTINSVYCAIWRILPLYATITIKCFNKMLISYLRITYLGTLLLIVYNMHTQMYLVRFVSITFVMD